MCSCTLTFFIYYFLAICDLPSVEHVHICQPEVAGIPSHSLSDIPGFRPTTQGLSRYARIVVELRSPLMAWGDNIDKTWGVYTWFGTVKHVRALAVKHGKKTRYGRLWKI